jgi:hypothetical protein
MSRLAPRADIARAALAARVRANVPSAADGDPVVVGFILEIIIASVIGWLVQRWLTKVCPARDLRNPGPVARWQLNKAIRRACAVAAAYTPDAVNLGLDADVIYAKCGGRVREAFLETGRQLDESELASLRSALAGE